MKKLLLSISFLSLIMWPACSDDTLLELMDRESGYMHLETVTSDNEINTYFKIPDSGQATEELSGDDGSFINTPNPINYSEELNIGISGLDDIVHDKTTGLIWTKCSRIDTGVMNTDDNCSGTCQKVDFNTSKNFCDSLQYAGYSDWRLPSLPELITLIDFGKTSPAINTVFFPNTRNDYYWTSTHIFAWGFLDWLWIINFENGDTGAFTFITTFVDISDTYYVRCVRGPD